MDNSGKDMKAITLAITGASGAQYGLRLLQQLVAASISIHFLISDAARQVIELETDIDFPAEPELMDAFFCEHYGAKPKQVRCYSAKQWTAAVASGSNAPSAMVVCPCSSGTLSAIACGASNNLIERAADVMIKERKKLIVVHREMPLSTIHLEHLLSLSKLGVIVMPASPGFYHQPKTIDDIVDFVVARIMDQLDIENQLMNRWGDDR